MFKKLLSSPLFSSITGFVLTGSALWFGLLIIPSSSSSTNSSTTPGSPAAARATQPAGSQASVSGGSLSYTPIPGAGPIWGPANLPAQNAEVVQLISLINQRRTTPLAWHNGLAATALVQATDMAVNHYQALVSPTGITAPQRLVSATPPMSFAASGNVVTSSTYFNQWIAENLIVGLFSDPSTTSVLSHPGMTHIGIAYVWEQPPTGAPIYKWSIIVGQNVTP